MLNNVILMGRMTQNPELRQISNGSTNCRFTIAIDRGAGPNGERHTDFINCTAWDKNAEFMSKFTEKGTMLIVEGTLRTGSYTDKKYPDVTHYTTDVLAYRVSFGETKAAHELMKQNAANRPQGGYGGQSGYNAQGQGGYNQGGYGNAQGGQSGQGGYNNSYNNAPQNRAPANSNPFDSFPPQIGGLSDFEEVISDSDLPF
jgi:single-strand DNA-binding protein